MPQPDVVQADTVKGPELGGDVGKRLEELNGFTDRYAQNISNVLALEIHFQGFAVVALAFADLAWHVHIRQKLHLDIEDTIALICYATRLMIQQSFLAMP